MVTVCCVFFVLFLLSQTSGAVQFTSPYQGKAVTALAGSSLSFTWVFPSSVDEVLWGLKEAAGNDIAKEKNLVLLNKIGISLPVSVPLAYQRRVSGSRNGGQATFILTNVTKEDKAVYGCKITQGSGAFAQTAFDHVEMVVHGPPSISQISLNQTVNEGDDVTLTCAAADSKPTPNITWTRLSDNSVVTFPLTVSKQDKGGYRCTADNGIGNPARGDVFITVQYKPEGVTISTGVAQNTVKQGQTVTFTCTVNDAFPPVSEYKFYLNGTIRTETDVNKFAIVGVSRSQHFGEYKCEAHNAAGDEQSAGVRLNINVPAEIKWLTGNVTVNETNPIDLRCDVSGYPPPLITWKKDGKEKGPGSNMLHIPSSTRNDSGTYVCIAENAGVGRAEMATFVTVNYRATITSATSTVTQSWIGRTVKLTCVADGVPTPVLTWKKPDGSELKKDTATENEADAEMKADNDFGFYTCHAENGVGAPATRKVEVKQIKAPGSPNITLVVQATSVSVTWTVPDNGSSPITGYRVVLLQGDSVIKNESVTNKLSWTKGELIKNTTYTVKVSARNLVFEGNAAEKKFTTKYEGPPAAPEIVGLPSSTNNVEITIRWNEPQNNGAPIVNYTVYQRTVRDDGTPQEWRKMNETKDPSVRQVAFKLEKGKNYEFVVTASNKFGTSIIEEEKIKKIKVLGDIPAPVQLTAEVEGSEITLKWTEPENNGAPITKYSVYQRFVNDQNWTKLEDIADTSKRDYVLKGDEGKEYEFVVTATNKYGESLKTKKKKAKVLKGKGTDGQNQASGGMNMAVIAGAAAAGVLLILALIIFGIWWKRRKAPSEHGSSVADLSGRNPDDFDDGYYAVGAAAAANQLQASGRAAEATYAQVDMSQKKNRRPVTDLYAEVDKSKKTKKKRQKQPGELDYAELDDLRPNFQPAPQPPGAAARPLVRAPAYEGTEYADITQFGVPQPEPTYDNVPKKDVVYSNVENI